MSINLRVIPTRNADIQWKTLREKWYEFCDEQRKPFLTLTPTFRRLGSNEAMADNYLLEINNAYYVELAIPNTLGISAYTNAKSDVAGHEQEILLDAGTNIHEAKVIELAHTWASIGYDYTIESLGGRSEAEPWLMIALANAFASLCDGFILVELGDCFTTGRGLFNLAQFVTTQPTFK